MGLLELGTGAAWSDAALALVVALGFGTQAALGFGSMLIIVGLGAQLLPIDRLVAVGALLSLLPNSVLTVRDHRHIHWPVLLRTILPWTALGVPAGVWLISVLPLPTVQLCYGVLTATLAARELARVHAAARRGRSVVEAPLGVASRSALLVVGGVIHGMFTTSGPMVVTVLGQLRLDKAPFRATLLALWLGLGLWTTSSLVLAGRVDAAVLLTALKLAPVLAVGSWVGDRLFRKVDAGRFAVAVQVLLLGSGLALVWRGGAG